MMRVSLPAELAAAVAGGPTEVTLRLVNVNDFVGVVAASATSEVPVR